MIGNEMRKGGWHLYLLIDEVAYGQAMESVYRPNCMVLFAEW